LALRYRVCLLMKRRFVLNGLRTGARRRLNPEVERGLVALAAV
jgi:hypothetical protein